MDKPRRKAVSTEWEPQLTISGFRMTPALSNILCQVILRSWIFHRPTRSRARDAITHGRDNRICSLRSAKSTDALVMSFGERVPAHRGPKKKIWHGRLISGDVASANEDAPSRRAGSRRWGCARRRGALSTGVANNTPSLVLDTEKLELSAFLEARNRHRRQPGSQRV